MDLEELKYKIKEHKEDLMIVAGVSLVVGVEIYFIRDNKKLRSTVNLLDGLLTDRNRQIGWLQDKAIEGGIGEDFITDSGGRGFRFTK